MEVHCGALLPLLRRFNRRSTSVTMTTLRQFTCDDMFRFNNINMDPLTETYGVAFYLQYLAR